MDNARASILQIIPATGWYALYYVEEEPYYDLSPIAAWALCLCTDADDEYRAMKAIDYDSSGFPEFADEASNHIRYVHQSDLDSGRLTLEGIKVDAIAWVERHQAKKK